jgi:hypothetical protein
MQCSGRRWRSGAEGLIIADVMGAAMTPPWPEVVERDPSTGYANLRMTGVVAAAPIGAGWGVRAMANRSDGDGGPAR